MSTGAGNDPFMDFTMAVNGHAVKDPGTYNVLLKCAQFGEPVQVGNANLLVWAVAK